MWQKDKLKHKVCKIQRFGRETHLKSRMQPSVKCGRQRPNQIFLYICYIAFGLGSRPMWRGCTWIQTSWVKNLIGLPWINGVNLEMSGGSNINIYDYNAPCKIFWGGQSNQILPMMSVGGGTCRISNLLCWKLKLLIGWDKASLKIFWWARWTPYRNPEAGYVG